jgi:lipopolysaccharide transport system ATP-binding protein
MLTLINDVMMRVGSKLRLRGRARISPAPKPINKKRAATFAAAASAKEPTVFHITHWKAGSQWIHRILHHLVYGRLVLPANLQQDQFLKWPIESGKVYPTVYVTKQQFDQVAVPAYHRRFVMIRDLRDTLVSWYFSIKVSHVMPNDETARWRVALRDLDEEAGLLDTMERWLPLSAAIQESWLTAGEPLLRYEDLLDNDLTILQRVLLDQCRLRVTAEQLRDAVNANRFEKITGGRSRGQENINSHERKGIVGDWRNYFTGRIKREFKDRFGELLIATGYEKNQDW